MDEQEKDSSKGIFATILAFFAVLFLAIGGGAPGPGKADDELENKQK